MLTAVARWKTVRPEAGWTKPTSQRLGSPGAAVLHRGVRAGLTMGRPHFAQERLQPNPMLVSGPHLDLGLREGGRDLP
jgi:hypothetical protein